MKNGMKQGQAQNNAQKKQGQHAQQAQQNQGQYRGQHKQGQSAQNQKANKQYAQNPQVGEQDEYDNE